MSTVQPVVLVTDVCVWLMLAGAVVGVMRARSAPHLERAWQQLRRNGTALSSLLLLGLYLAVGFADSLHLRSPALGRGEVVSVLDLALWTLRENTEKTYSAPLALNSYTRESRPGPDGSVTREFPRLRHAAPTLHDPTAHSGHVLRLGGLGAAAGGMLWMALAGGLCWRLARKHGVNLRAAAAQLSRGHSETAWRPLLVTTALLCVGIGMAAALATQYHVLGTDKVGQDVLYLSLKAVRTGLIIGALTLVIMLPLAGILGIAAGYFGGWVDDLIQYLYTTLSSIPGVLLIAAAVLTLDAYMDGLAGSTGVGSRADLRLLALCIILGVTGWIGLCRLLRGETLKLRELEYVQAARALGVGHWTTVYRHLLPGVTHIILITAVIDFSGLVLAEAVLSYVGVGVDPSMVSWGNMINSARLELAREPAVWWSLAAAFGFMLALVLPANLLSDAVRDALDPRLDHSH